VHLEWGTVVKTLNWTFVANLVNFAILLYLLKRFLFKPALAYLDRRRELIASRMEAARQSEEKAEQLAAQREQELSWRVSRHVVPWRTHEHTPRR